MGTCGPSAALRPDAPPLTCQSSLTIFPEAEPPAPTAVGPGRLPGVRRRLRDGRVLSLPSCLPSHSRSRAVDTGFPPPAAAKTRVSGGSAFDGKCFPDGGSFHVDFITASEVVRGARGGRPGWRGHHPSGSARPVGLCVYFSGRASGSVPAQTRQRVGVPRLVPLPNRRDHAVRARALGRELVADRRTAGRGRSQPWGFLVPRRLQFAGLCLRVCECARPRKRVSFGCQRVPV